MIERDPLLELKAENARLIALLEAMHYLLDWNFDEDHCRIRTGFGPENITRLRRFAIGVLTSFQKPGQSIASMMRKLCLRSRIVLDYLRLTIDADPTQLFRENKYAVRNPIRPVAH